MPRDWRYSILPYLVCWRGRPGRWLRAWPCWPSRCWHWTSFTFSTRQKEGPRWTPSRTLRTQTQRSQPGRSGLNTLCLLAPPVILILWFLSLVWGHQTLTRPELIATVAAMPAVVGLMSWIIYLRMTRYHVGVRNHATRVHLRCPCSRPGLGRQLFDLSFWPCAWC